MASEDLNEIPASARSGAHFRRQLFLELLAYKGVACARILSLKRQQQVLILLTFGRPEQLYHVFVSAAIAILWLAGIQPKQE